MRMRITVPSSNPPPESIKSITNLTNTTFATDFITWTWTDPTDSDFDHVMVYLDGTFQTTITKESQRFQATGLFPDTSYTISTKTVDHTGNINASWVNHTAFTAPLPDITPPGNIRNLQNSTFLANSIEWIWNDPDDTDFDHVMVYLDDTFQTTITKESQRFQATGLLPDTSYTISTKTVDHTGNINASWVNHTAFTAPLPDITPPGNIRNLQNSTFLANSIEWIWNDPDDTDFDQVIVYLDDKFQTTITKESQRFQATGLLPDTSYTISTKTVDHTGNINASWVNHTAFTAPLPDITPPGNIRNLQNSTFLANSIEWVWNDPDDTDFDHVIVYLDDTFQTTITKESQHFQATGLLPDTSYTISTKTVDLTGNINASWVNQTAWTKSVAPIADFTASSLKGLVPLKVTFSDLSIGEPDSHLWNFGDGATSSDQNPDHTYSTQGIYSVSLTVEDEGGSSSVHKSGYITVDGPIKALPGLKNLPRDLNGDGRSEDLDGNERVNANDVVLLARHFQWIQRNEPGSAFDFNNDGRFDFRDLFGLSQYMVNSSG